MACVREVKEEISEGKYIKYQSIPNADSMRLKVRDELLPPNKRENWLGCKLEQSGNQFYVTHMYYNRKESK